MNLIISFSLFEKELGKPHIGISLSGYPKKRFLPMTVNKIDSLPPKTFICVIAISLVHIILIDILNMTTGNGKVTRWWRNDKIIAADESNDKPFSCVADEVWGDVDANKLYNPNPLSIDEVLEMQRQKREADQYHGEDWRPKAVTTFMQAANNARDKDGNFPRRDKRERRRMMCSAVDKSLPPSKTLSQKDGKSYQQDDIVFESNGDGDFSVAMSSLGDDSISNTNEKMNSRKKDKSVNPTVNDYREDNKVDSEEVEQSVSLMHGNTSSPTHPGSLSLSDNIGKSTNTEGVESLVYPEDNSFGASVTPPEVEMLAGGKRKGGTRNKKKSKKSKSNNGKVHGGCRVLVTPLGSGEELRECLKRALLKLLVPEEMKRVHELSVLFPSSPDGGDVTIEQGNTWLMKHGMILILVTDRYIKKGGILFHLLQDSECRLVIKAKLTMHDGSGVANHFIAYDSTTLHDVPHSIKPSRDDRSEKGKCRAIFQKLYPTEEYSAFEVTNVFELCTATANTF